MFIHLSQNPCLGEEWRNLWPRLQDHGWRAVDLSKENFVVEGVAKSQTIVYAFRPETIHKLIPGIHVFASKLALAQYIARYDFYLAKSY